MRPSMGILLRSRHPPKVVHFTTYSLRLVHDVGAVPIAGLVFGYLRASNDPHALGFFEEGRTKLPLRRALTPALL